MAKSLRPKHEDDAQTKVVLEVHGVKYVAYVDVQLKQSILDPQGEAVRSLISIRPTPPSPLRGAQPNKGCFHAAVSPGPCRTHQAALLQASIRTRALRRTWSTSRFRD